MAQIGAASSMRQKCSAPDASVDAATPLATDATTTLVTASVCRMYCAPGVKSCRLHDRTAARALPSLRAAVSITASQLDTATALTLARCAGHENMQRGLAACDHAGSRGASAARLPRKASTKGGWYSGVCGVSGGGV